MLKPNTRRIVSRCFRHLQAGVVMRCRHAGTQRHLDVAALALACVATSLFAIGAIASADELELTDTNDTHGPHSKPTSADTAKPLREASKPTSNEDRPRLKLVLRSPKPQARSLPSVQKRPAFRSVEPQVIVPQRKTAEQKRLLQAKKEAARKRALAIARTKANLERLIQQLDSSEAEERRSAATELGWNGLAAKRALPTLRKSLEDTTPAVRIAAASAIWEITRQPGSVVPILTELARSDVNSVAPHAARALGTIGADAKRSLPDLQKSLRSNTGLNQISIAEAILRIDDQNKEAFELLSAALSDRVADMRCQAAYSLVASINSRPEEIQRILQPVLDDDFEYVVAAARSTLNQLGEAGKADQHARQDAHQNKLSRLVLQLHNRDANLRKEALAHLAWLGTDAESVLYDIELRLKDESHVVRAAAAWAAWSVGGLGEVAVKTLDPLLVCEDEDLSSLAVDILGSMKVAAQPALGALRSRLQRSEGLSRLQLAATIARIAPKDEAAVDVLLSFLKDDDADIRSRVAFALGAVGIDQVGRVVSPLAECLNDDAMTVGSTAKLTLAEFLESTESGMTGLTAYIVAGLESDARPLIPILHKRLETSDGLTRIQIAEAIVGIDALDIVAVDALTAELSAKDATMRCQSAYALAGIDAILRDRVMEQLLSAAQDSNEQVRLAARTTLKTLSTKTPLKSDRLTSSADQTTTPESSSNLLATDSSAPAAEGRTTQLSTSGVWSESDASVMAPIPVSASTNGKSAATRVLPLPTENNGRNIVRTSNTVLVQGSDSHVKAMRFEHHRSPVRLDRDLVDAVTIWNTLLSID